GYAATRDFRVWNPVHGHRDVSGNRSQSGVSERSDVGECGRTWLHERYHLVPPAKSLPARWTDFVVEHGSAGVCVAARRESIRPDVEHGFARSVDLPLGFRQCLRYNDAVADAFVRSDRD